MKDIEKYLLYICNIVLTGLIIFNIISYDLKESDITISNLESQEGKYISYLEIDNVKEVVLPTILETKEEEIVKTEVIEATKDEVVSQQPVIKEEIKVEQPVIEEIVQEAIKQEVQEEVKQEIIKPTEAVIETLVGNLVGYGPDCSGCTSFKTASGKYIGEGNIYYDDATYGRVRIVAGDYSYPFGTIVRISNVDFYNDEPFYAVVLDRGGNIGKNKKYLFDLLFATEKEALSLGKEVNIKYEIMRLGY